MSRNADTFFISMWDDKKFSTTREITKQGMKQISFFRVTFEEMIDEILKIQLTSIPLYGSSSYLNTPTNPF
jgi:hypothetical protein